MRTLAVLLLTAVAASSADHKPRATFRREEVQQYVRTAFLCGELAEISAHPTAANKADSLRLQLVKDQCDAVQAFAGTAKEAAQ